MRERTNYEWNYNLESNVIDLAKAKKIIRHKKIKNKVKKNNIWIKKNKKNTEIKQVNKHKTYDIIRSSIYKRIVILSFICIFACGVIFSWYKLEIYKNVFLTRFGTKCTGKIIDTVEDVRLLVRGDSIVYRSTIQFITTNGENVKFETGNYKNPYKYNKEAIKVIYNSDNPKMVKVYSFDALIMPVVVFIVSGIVFVLFPIYLICFDCLKKLKILNGRKFV